ncbi:iron-sulfur cluster co-chaperone protein HscB-like isoform X2 [Acipenser ruthenus]|uniref:iron-sulfur cluster co-chaperone protein HscB-like isoform X2 n=1 Tax=Acipenser ruthenus TaxID=7906 RepID=UPI00274190BB|nr:iron-sulfur cluster co-chaperone protein HscB-like isoform X2 [Acipenser ruthenus]
MLVLNRLRPAASSQAQSICLVNTRHSLSKSLKSTTTTCSDFEPAFLNENDTDSPTRHCLPLTHFWKCLETRQQATAAKLFSTTSPYSQYGLGFRTFSTVLKTQNCWNCGESLQQTHTYFCTTCKVLQPPDEDRNYFDIMDCENSFAVDIQKLQRTYRNLQRSLHPDNFSQKQTKEQELSEKQSALVNEAYRTLLGPLSRGLYMLKLQGLQLEEGTHFAMEPQFLNEIMEINESLAATQTEEEASDIGHCIQDRLQELIRDVSESFSKGDLKKAKMLLAKMKYFVNIEDKVKEKLSSS